MIDPYSIAGRTAHTGLSNDLRLDFILIFYDLIFPFGNVYKVCDSVSIFINIYWWGKVMKRSILYTAVFSAMLVMTGCGGGGESGDGNKETNQNTSQNNNSGSNNENNQNIGTNNNQNSNQNTQQPEKDAWVVKGRVVDNNQQVVENAKVSVLLENVEYSTKSDKNGEYALKLPQDFKYPEHLSGIVYAEGYKPTTLLLSYQNKTLYIDGESNNPIIKKMQEQDVIFFNGLTVIHLGDDFATGSANSQFQIKAQGISWKDSFIYSAAKKSKYDQICISLMGKGIQTDSDVKNIIALSKNGQAGTSVSQPFKSSAESGEYTNLEHCFSLQSFNAEDQIELLIQSYDGGNSYDDFEMINIEGVFKSSGNTSNSGNISTDGSNTGSGNASSNGNTNNGTNGGSNNSNSLPLCTSSSTSAGTVQCIGKDNINYLFGSFNSHIGNVAGYSDHTTGDIQTATSCSVTRSGNDITVNIPSLGVSAKITGEALQVITPSTVEGQSLIFLTSHTDKAGYMQNTSYNGQVIKSSAVTVGTKTYTCAQY